LPKCGAVNIEESADAALSGLNPSVYPVSEKVDKEGRDFGEQLLKCQPLFQGVLRLLASGDILQKA